MTDTVTGADPATHCHLPHCSPWLVSGTQAFLVPFTQRNSDCHGTVRRKSQNKSIQVYLSKCQQLVQRSQLSADNPVEILDKPFNSSRIQLFYLEIISCNDLKSLCSINMLQPLACSETVGTVCKQQKGRNTDKGWQPRKTGWGFGRYLEDEWFELA